RRAVGLCALPLWALGVRKRSLGLVSGRVRCAAVVGAGARRVVWRQRLGLFGIVRRTGLWLGAARLARALRAVVARVHVELLRALQPTLRGERGGTAQRAADAFRELVGSRRHHR